MSAPINAGPIPVRVANLPQQKRYSTTTVRTYVIDPAGSGDGKQASIASYEPTRERLMLIVVDAAVALTLEAPKASPDPNTAAGTAPQGGYLPPNTNTAPYEFFGPDAFYLNSLTAITRVTVIKEYCVYGDA